MVKLGQTPLFYFFINCINYIPVIFQLYSNYIEFHSVGEQGDDDGGGELDTMRQTADGEKKKKKDKKKEKVGPLN